MSLHINEIISKTVALSIHKSLIGVAQLYALEKASEKHEFGSFRSERAILTYYTVYHLFCTSMLLSDQYTTSNIKKIYKCKGNDKYVGTVSADKLNSPCETPEQWDCQKAHERDLATMIGHSDVKEYCQELRKAEDLTQHESILYKAFVNDFIDADGRCIPGLYEKLCYVRDRMIYRPSFVISKEGVLFQTSSVSTEL